jgi:hypothetical protein
MKGGSMPRALPREEIEMLVTASNVDWSDKANEIFSFDDIVETEDHVIRTIVGRVGIGDLAKALIHERDKLRKKFYRNMSLADLESLNKKLLNVERFDVQEKKDAQRRILSIIAHFDEYRDYRFQSSFRDIEEFEAFLIERRMPETPYGTIHNSFGNNISMCRFFESKSNENILADIEMKNKEQGMGNIEIPHTKIKLVNYSICPTCGHVYSFKDLADYYAHPKPDPAFKNRYRQFREDARVHCFECDTYFLPALVIVDGTPKNEVQFLCRIQTMNAIERFYQEKGIKVLSTKKENHLTKEKSRTKHVRGIRNDVLLKEMEPKPTLISNLLQYTPVNLTLNLINGENVKKGDPLFGFWQ